MRLRHAPGNTTSPPMGRWVQASRLVGRKRCDETQVREACWLQGRDVEPWQHRHTWPDSGQVGGRRPQGLRILGRTKGPGDPMACPHPKQKSGWGFCFFVLFFSSGVFVVFQLFFWPLQKAFCIDDFAVWCFYICKIKDLERKLHISHLKIAISR